MFITLNAPRVPRLNGQPQQEPVRPFRGRSLGTSRVTRGTNERALALWVEGPLLSLFQLNSVYILSLV